MARMASVDVGSGASQGRMATGSLGSFHMLLILLAGFLVTAVAQAWVSPTAELDQAEQLILAQQLHWGYGNQPPLYSWLVHLVQRLAGGPSLAVLFGVKLGLLALLLLAVRGTCGELQLGERRTTLALAGYAWLPAFVWEAQRDLTHSLLAATMAALLLWTGLRAVRRGRWGDHVAVGLAAAAALLSKHNALVFVVALLVTVLSVPCSRARLRPVGLALSIVLALAVLSPYLVWLLGHAAVLQGTWHKLDQGGEGGRLAGFAHLGWALVKGWLGFLLPWLLPALMLLRRQAQPSEAGRFMSRLLAWVAVLVLVPVLMLEADSFKARWLTPLLFAAPIWLAANVSDRNGLWSKVMVQGGLAWLVLVAVVMPARIVWPQLGEPQTRQNVAFTPMARELAGQWGQVPPVVLVSQHFAGGNLLLHWPATTRVWTPIVHAPAALPDRLTVVYTEQDRRDAVFDRWLWQHTGWHAQALPVMGVVQAPVAYRPEAPAQRWYWAQVPLRHKVEAARAH